MTSGQASGGPSAARLGGFALIGVGALAAVFGVATVVSGEPETVANGPGGAGVAPTSSATGRPPATSEPETPTSTRSRPSSPTRTEPSAPAPTPPQSGGQPGESAAGRPGAGPTSGSGPGSGRVPPGAGQAGPRPPAGDSRPGSSREIVLRVYNNSKIRGLAQRAAEDFRAAGYRVAEIDNYSDGRIPVTTIYYRPGTPERAQARIVADRFGARVEPRFAGISDASPGVIAIVTKNYDGPEQGK